MKRKLLMSAAAVLLAATASPALADHSRVAVSVSYGPTAVHYVSRDRYWDGHRYVRYDRRYDRRYYRRYNNRRIWYPANWNRYSRSYRHHRDWCPIERGHWH